MTADVNGLLANRELLDSEALRALQKGDHGKANACKSESAALLVQITAARKQAIQLRRDEQEKIDPRTQQKEHERTGTKPKIYSSDKNSQNPQDKTIESEKNKKASGLKYL